MGVSVDETNQTVRANSVSPLEERTRQLTLVLVRRTQEYFWKQVYYKASRRIELDQFANESRRLLFVGLRY